MAARDQLEWLVAHPWVREIIINVEEAQELLDDDEKKDSDAGA